jgi:hypothetical protein
MRTIQRVVGNREFLLGLDELYREAMKRHETNKLLGCARATASALHIAPADVPIEGYYTETPELTEYFRLVRAIQGVPIDRESEVQSIAGYQRLKEVAGSPIFGAPAGGFCLLSFGKDSLSFALEETFPEWNIPLLTQTAYRIARDSEDYSLVALAALSQDPVVLAALRESVVLYAMAFGGSGGSRETEFVWKVDQTIETRAKLFVAAFNSLFDDSLPEPTAANAEIFWNACDEWKIVGRCVRIGFDDSLKPIRHYHWAIERDVQHKLQVKDFWDTELWTTARFRGDDDDQIDDSSGLERIR